MAHNFIDMSGRKCGRWTVIKRVEDRSGAAAWLCKCDCGNEKVVSGANLRKGTSKSCGCLRTEVTIEKNKRMTKHDDSHSRLYAIWRGMKDRCKNPNATKYKNYGGKGVSVCAEWESQYTSFKEWAIKNGYKDNLTLDRIDPNGMYSPDNCRWATIKQQENNRTNNHLLTIDDETKTLTEWCEIFGVSTSTVINRLNIGCSPKEALTLPPYYRWRNNALRSKGI